MTDTAINQYDRAIANTPKMLPLEMQATNTTKDQEHKVDGFSIVKFYAEKQEKKH